MTPTGRHALTYDEESWRQQEESASSKETGEEIGRNTETRKSKTKRVKNYLKKCKNVLGNRSGAAAVSDPNTTSGSGNDATATSSWYVEKSLELNESEIKELEDVFEEVQSFDCFADLSRIANVIDVKRPSTSKYLDENVTERAEEFSDSEPVAPSALLTHAQKLVEEDPPVEDVEDVDDVEMVETKKEEYGVFEVSGRKSVSQKFSARVFRYFACILPLSRRSDQKSGTAVGAAVAGSAVGAAVAG